MIDDPTVPDRLRTWERRTEWPLAGAAVLFLVAYAWAVLEPDLSPGLDLTLNLVDYSTWAVFGVDYVVRVTLAHPRGRYVLHNLPDLLILVLPILRPLRLLRLVFLLKVLNRQATNSLRGRVIAYVLSGSVLVLFSAALAVLSAERGQRGANITTFGDALWWAMTTITTVGYGDRYPVTTQGRFVAAGLMIAGIALLGVVTASLASWLVDRVREDQADAEAATHRDIEQLRKEIARLTAAVTTGQDAADRAP